MFCCGEFHLGNHPLERAFGFNSSERFCVIQKVINFGELTLQPLSVSWVTAQISVGLLCECPTYVWFRFSQRLEQMLCIELGILPF